MPEIRDMTDDELVAVPEKTRDGNLATAATLEMLRRLKESVDLTLELEKQRNDPLRRVLHEINEQGG